MCCYCYLLSLGGSVCRALYTSQLFSSGCCEWRLYECQLPHSLTASAAAGGEGDVNTDCVCAVLACNMITIHMRTQTHTTQVFYSPSCLRATTNSTAATGAAETEVLSSHQFCMLPSLDHLPAGVAGLISHFDWQRVAVLSEEGSYFVMIN